MVTRTQKTVRIRPKAYRIYKYLEYNYVGTHNSYNALFDDIIDFSLNYANSNHLYFRIVEYKGRRIVKGFSLSQPILDKFNTFCEKNAHLQIAQIVEMFLYIYAAKKLSKVEFKTLNINYIKHGFTKIYT